jgi:hypothetical protein
MIRRDRSAFVALSFGALLMAAIALAAHGKYGWTLFVVLPMVAGALSVWTFKPRTLRHTFGIGALTGALGCTLFLLVGLEGFFCVLMAMPVVIPLTTIGSLLAYWGEKPSMAKRPVAMSLLIPVSMLFDLTAAPPVYSVSTQIVVNAPPEHVWKHVVAFRDIPAQPDWLLRSGLAYPIRTDIFGEGEGVLRNCELSTGTVKEKVTAWDEPRLL